jgi:hypothetical protein
MTNMKSKTRVGGADALPGGRAGDESHESGNAPEQLAREKAEELFRVMPGFDHFDAVLLQLDSILFSITNMEPGEARLVKRFYDFSELEARLSHYSYECARLANVVRKIIHSCEQGKQGRAREG